MFANTSNLQHFKDLLPKSTRVTDYIISNTDNDSDDHKNDYKTTLEKK